MEFYIKKVLLWSINEENNVREIEFKKGKINIITGESRTGKSAIIPIVDYCMGSSKCSIPVDTIRDACSWFGVLFSNDREELLVCRKVPGESNSTGIMYYERGSDIIIPKTIPKAGNDHLNSVKSKLNELFEMSFLKLNPSDETSFTSRPSYRDFSAFLFQPQNIVANADILFYKADTYEHRTKLIEIFPYILGIVTPDILEKKHELELFKKKHRRSSQKLEQLKKVTSEYEQEVDTWIMLACEYGFIDEKNNHVTKDFTSKLNLLNAISKKNISDSNLMLSNLDKSNEFLVNLQVKEEKCSADIFKVQSRLQQMEKLKITLPQYQQALRIQKEHLGVSEWILNNMNKASCPICDNELNEDQKVMNLFNKSKEIEKSLHHSESMPIAVEREFTETKKDLEFLVDVKKNLHNQIEIYTNRHNEYKQQKYSYESIARYLGKIQTKVEIINSVSVDDELQIEISELEQNIRRLGKEINDWEIEKNVAKSLKKITDKSEVFLRMLDVERPNAKISFSVKDLTIKIVNPKNKREDYLWEIGSGSNWVSYHIAIILSFHWYFQKNDKVKVPNFMIFDQPSQVYFPQTSEINGKEKLRDTDKEAVKKMFNAMSKFLEELPESQIIVTEHADEDIWGEINGINLVERWRDGKYLVPNEWTED